MLYLRHIRENLTQIRYEAFPSQADGAEVIDLLYQLAARGLGRMTGCPKM